MPRLPLAPLRAALSVPVSRRALHLPASMAASISRAGTPSIPVPVFLPPSAQVAFRARWISGSPVCGDWQTPGISYEELKPITSQPTGNVLLIDVREPNEVIQGSIPSSVNLPLSVFEKALDLPAPEFLKAYGFEKPSAQGADAREVVFYCRSGKRSATACDLAARRGIKKIRNYEGSWLDWTAKEEANKGKNTQNGWGADE